MGITSRPGYTPPGTPYIPAPIPPAYTPPIQDTPTPGWSDDPILDPSYYRPKPVGSAPPMGGNGAIPRSNYTIPDNFFGFLMLIRGV